MLNFHLSLQFADLVLKGKKDNLLFDSSKKGISAMRREIKQYLAECSSKYSQNYTIVDILKSLFLIQ